MLRHLSNFRYVIVTGLALFFFGTFALAQSCGETAYNDVKNCQDAFNLVKNASNTSAGSVGQAATGNGYSPSQQTNGTASMAAGGWTQVQSYCTKRLNECNSACTSPADANYLKACNNQISAIITASGQAGASNSTIAGVAGSINSASADQAAVQQASGFCTAAMVAARIAMCVLSPPGAPSSMMGVYTSQGYQLPPLPIAQGIGGK